MIKQLLRSLLLVFTIVQGQAQTQKNSSKESLTIKGTQNWYIGVTAEGNLMPLQEKYEVNFKDAVFGNQAQPLILSDKGDVIWNEEPFKVSYTENSLKVIDFNEKTIHTKAGNSLKEAYLFAKNNYFSKSKAIPDEQFFSVPQYNTWIELTYNQNQKDILKYAHNIIDNGMPPGILMIDDNWQEDYGKWNFHKGRFPDPKAMMKELHELGFKVMLWVCPFVSADSDVYRSLVPKQVFLITPNKESIESILPQKDFRGNPKPQMVDWWNGISAVLDLSKPEAEQWFKGELNRLQKDYGVDGFKFDAGDAEFYKTGVSYGNVSANTQAELFAKVGLDYPLNEYRATWKMGGEPLVQRLRDKGHNWEDLQKLVPQMALSGIMGYPFNCPDMIGGGDFISFLEGSTIDQELLVRSAQVHALMPMMQFSVAPWRVLDEKHFSAVKKAVSLREKFSDYILKTAKQSAQTREPILRPMEYDYPNQGYVNVTDQFLLGEKLLVVPVVKKGVEKITVFIPKGKWKSFQNKKIKGPKKITLKVGLEDLPYFEKI